MFDDSVFNDVLTVKPKRNILDINAIAWMDVPPGEQQALKYQAMQTVDVKSPGQFRRRVLEYIHVNSLNNTPLRLSSVNNRFTRLAKQHGTSTIETIQQLIMSGHLIELERGKVRALFSHAVLLEKRAFRAQAGESSDLVDILMQYIDGASPVREVSIPVTASKSSAPAEVIDYKALYRKQLAEQALVTESSPDVK